MASRSFTAEEIRQLKANPYTNWVTPGMLSFTKEFKAEFWKRYQAGQRPRDIVQDLGYDPEMLGDRRIWGISHHIRKQYEKYGEVREGVTYAKPPSSEKPMSEKDELKQLRHEVDYMKQEIEFLKKISSIRSTRK